MSTRIVDVQKEQTQLADLLSLVAAGTEVLLTDGATPLARLIPVATPNSPRIAGLHAGLENGAYWMSEDFDDPLPQGSV